MRQVTLPDGTPVPQLGLGTWHMGERAREAAAEVRALIERPGDARVVDLHVWRVGPEAHAAIVSVVAPGVSRAAIHDRLGPIHELAHITIECR